MKSLLVNWKTTLAGLIGLAGVIVPAVAPEYAPVVAKISAAAVAAGLIVARDAAKSSEQSGADKQPSLGI